MESGYKHLTYTYHFTQISISFYVFFLHYIEHFKIQFPPHTYKICYKLELSSTYHERDPRDKHNVIPNCLGVRLCYCKHQTGKKKKKDIHEFLHKTTHTYIQLQAVSPTRQDLLSHAVIQVISQCLYQLSYGSSFGQIYHMASYH